MNLLELMRVARALDDVALPSRESFGRLMHDDDLTDERKAAIVKKVELAGGYSALEDDCPDFSL